MKRIMSTGALVVVSFVIFYALRLSGPIAPRFELLRTLPSLQPSNHITYDFLSPKPFDGGKIWIDVSIGTTNALALLYDIDGRKVLGRLTDGWPVAMTDSSTLLCVQRLSEGSPLKKRLIGLVERISGGRIKLSRPSPGLGEEPTKYWLLDLEKNSASSVGNLPQGSSLPFQLSPDSRYGYIPIHDERLELEVYCFDSKRRSIRKRDVHGWPSGWWDRTKLLIVMTNNDFVLHDITTDKTTPLLGSRQIATFLSDNKITQNSALTGVFSICFSVWNGREYVFYLTGIDKGGYGHESYLIRVDRPEGELTLLSRHFKFEWLGHFDPTGCYYAFDGRLPGAASDAVFLREMQSGTKRTLVDRTPNGHFSIPRFYGESIIYVRSNMLWKINLDGTKNIQLFPP